MKEIESLIDKYYRKFPWKRIKGTKKITQNMTTEQWLEEKVSAYNENPKEALEDMLSTTTDIIEQYIKSPNIATKGVLDACLEQNKLFIQKIMERVVACTDDSEILLGESQMQTEIDEWNHWAKFANEGIDERNEIIEELQAELDKAKEIIKQLNNEDNA